MRKIPAVFQKIRGSRTCLLKSLHWIRLAAGLSRVDCDAAPAYNFTVRAYGAGVGFATGDGSVCACGGRRRLAVLVVAPAEDRTGYLVESAGVPAAAAHGDAYVGRWLRWSGSTGRARGSDRRAGRWSCGMRSCDSRGLRGSWCMSCCGPGRGCLCGRRRGCWRRGQMCEAVSKGVVGLRAPT